MSGKKGFTLIEILVVIGILAIMMALTLIAINPIENLNKTTDFKTMAITTDVVQSSLQQFAETKIYPWENNQNCMEELSTGETLADMPSCIHQLTQNDDLDRAYNSMSEIRGIYVNKCGNSAVLCFNPKSKSMNESSNTRYNKYGAQDPGCPPVSGISPDCFVCIPVSNEPGCYNKSTPTPILTNIPTPVLTDTLPTNTPIPLLTDMPAPTNSPIPFLTDTPAPTDTLIPSITPAVEACNNTLFPTPTLTDCLNNPISPPTVSISASDCIVTAGMPFAITVGASSCIGLAAVWWYGAGGPDTDAVVSIIYPPSPVSSQMFTVPFSNPAKLKRAFGSPYFTASQAVHNYSFTSTIIIPIAGIYTFGANSRDVLYPVRGQAHQASEGTGQQFVKIQVTDNSSLPQ